MYPYEPTIQPSYPTRPSTAMKDYHTLHEGVTATRENKGWRVHIDPSVKQKVIKKGDKWFIMIFAKCSALADDGSCKLINSPRRPKICGDAYTKVKDGVMFMPNCIYTPASKSIVLTEADIS